MSENKPRSKFVIVREFRVGELPPQPEGMMTILRNDGTLVLSDEYAYLRTTETGMEEWVPKNKLEVYRERRKKKEKNSRGRITDMSPELAPNHSPSLRVEKVLHGWSSEKVKEVQIVVNDEHSVKYFPKDKDLLRKLIRLLTVAEKELPDPTDQTERKEP